VYGCERKKSIESIVKKSEEERKKFYFMKKNIPLGVYVAYSRKKVEKNNNINLFKVLSCLYNKKFF
jgi:hypothetical protein